MQFGVNAAPGIVRKAGGGGQIGGYAVVGGGPVTPYADDQRTTAWSDGTPTAVGTANRNGVYIDGVGNGYSITVPASTISRTVTMLVGGWNSGGTLRAHLGDGSSADYVDTTAVASGSYYRTYTITYAAASTTTLTLSWTQSAGPSNANVTLKAVALSAVAAANMPPSITTPAAQTSTVGQAASLAISASDPNGDALTYSASGLPAGLSINASSGLISGTPTTAGASSVTVTVNDGRGGIATASFGWTVQAAGTGSLGGAVSTTPGAVNLTTLGTADWVQFGVGQVVPGIVRKASGGSQISGYTIVGAGPAKPYIDDLRPASWSDGTPTASGTNNRSGVYIDAVGNGYSITVPAGTASRTVTMLVGGWELRRHLARAPGRQLRGRLRQHLRHRVGQLLPYLHHHLCGSLHHDADADLDAVLRPSNANVTLKAVALSAVAGHERPADDHHAGGADQHRGTGGEPGDQRQRPQRATR